ncbi:MAG: flavodoxin [Oscillospiraceae bacterium]|jgi:flavodoxin short chain|nr:flavodoxin [Oscillospiraceae bacterium]
MKISIIYWSGTGNTEAMANLIADGAKGAGAEVYISEIGKLDHPKYKESDVLVLGCPAMGSEVLEEDEFEPFIQHIEPKLTGRKLALFGSYDWGEGQWMRDWTERMTKAGAVLAADSLIVNNTPSGESAQQCRDFGAKIAGGN